MSGVRVFTDLRIWQQSRQWSKDIFAHTRRDPFRSDRRLVTQINDSSSSVMANIAEGFGRGTQGEFVTFLGYSIGSLRASLLIHDLSGASRLSMRWIMLIWIMASLVSGLRS